METVTITRETYDRFIETEKTLKEIKKGKTYVFNYGCNWGDKHIYTNDEIIGKLVDEANVSRKELNERNKEVIKLEGLIKKRQNLIMEARAKLIILGSDLSMFNIIKSKKTIQKIKKELEDCYF